MILVLDNVEKSFGALRVIDGVSLSVAEGEALGIIGPNGAGKTTLFSLASGALKPQFGKGHPEWPRRDRARTRGPMPRRRRAFASGSVAV